MDEINLRLCKMRKHLKVSQAEFGATGGVSQSTQNRYEQTANVPLSYLNKIYDGYGANINKIWFYFGKGKMLASNDQSPTLNTVTDLSATEARIIAEVIQFSNFIQQRPLRPEVKRLLLELLIENIDNVLTKLHDDEPVLQ